MMVIVFSMNLFGEVISEKTEDHVCTTECNHEEVIKECEPDCTKPCCSEIKPVDEHICTEKCETAKNHVCTDECKSDNSTETCELAILKNTCLNTVEEQGCNPVGCGQKAVKKGCGNI